MNLINTQRFPQRLQLIGRTIDLPPNSQPVAVTDADIREIKERYTIADLPKYGIILDTSSPARIAPPNAPAAKPPAAGDSLTDSATPDTTPAAGTEKDPSPNSPATVSLRDIQAKIRDGAMSTEEAEALLAAEVERERPRITVIKELEKALGRNG